jgi:VWFA-related protein
LASVRSSGGISTRIENVDSAAFPEIGATIHVFSDKPGENLRSDDFRVSEDGKKIDKFRVRVDPRPVYLVLVLDESGSMKPALAHLKKAAFEFLDILDDRVRTQLITFSETVRPRTGFLSDARLIQRKVGQIKANGGTRLYDAVDLAARNVGPYPQDVRRVVVSFTDGKDGKKGLSGRLSKHSAKAVAKYARSHGVPLYFLGLGKGVNKKLLTKLAAATGGEALFSAGAADLRSIFKRMAHSLETSYRLSYTSPNPSPDGTVRKIRVTSVRKGRKNQGQGRYKAPKIAKSRGLSPLKMAGRRGYSAYRRVFQALRGLGDYAVGVNSSVTVPGIKGAAGVDLTTDLDLTHVANVGTALDLNLDLGADMVGVNVIRQANDAYLKVGRVGGPDLETRINLAGRTDVSWLQNPVETVIGWMGASGQKGAKVSPPKNGSAYLFESPDKIRLVDSKGKSGGVLTFDRKSFLPTHLISIDPETGASSNVRFHDWQVNGKFQIALPDVPKVSAEAEKFALRTAEISLKTAGSALRTADQAVDASLAAGKLGLEAGLKGGQAGIDAANRSIQMIQPWTNKGVGIAVKTLGGVSEMLGSKGFQDAVSGGPQSAVYWSKFATDFDGSFMKEFDASMKQFDKDMNTFMIDLDHNLTAQSRQFEADMEVFSQKLEQNMVHLGEDLTDMGNQIAADATNMGLEMGRRGAQIGIDAAADATDMAMDAAQMGAEMGRRGAQIGLDAAADATDMALDAAEMGAEMGLRGARIGRDAARAAQNIEAIGQGTGLGGLKNLGGRLRGLGGSMNQGQGYGGGWGDDENEDGDGKFY